VNVKCLIKFLFDWGIMVHKVALITAGSKGIGKSIAIELAHNGLSVAITSRDEREGKKVCKQINKIGVNCLSVCCDVTDYGSLVKCIKKVKNKIGSVDVLVNNAGALYTSELVYSDIKLWENDFKVNLMGTYYLSKIVLPCMIENKWGRIINLSSRRAIAPEPLTSSYCASKAAIIGLTKSLALETIDYGITVNAICPANINTKPKSKITKYNTSNITPEDCAKLVSFLASDDAKSITAQSINVSRGLELI
jgi:3-oxoacyl-[acyl-carrier protein] reductase